MSKRKIIIEPDPILRKKSATLEKVDNSLRKLMDDMLETMYSAPGIGLAAVQIGILPLDKKMIRLMFVFEQRIRIIMDFLLCLQKMIV